MGEVQSWDNLGTFIRGDGRFVLDAVAEAACEPSNIIRMQQGATLRAQKSFVINGKQVMMNLELRLADPWEQPEVDYDIGGES